MDIIQIVLFGMIAALIYIVLKDIKPSMAFFIILITAILILSVVIHYVGIIILLLRDLSMKASIQSIHLDTILKIIGIAYITEIGANVTRDAGLSSIASKIELAGKIFILILAVPIISAVVEVILNFIPATNSFFIGKG